VGFLVSAVVSSFVFAAIHPQGWAAIPVLGAIAFVLAGIREWRGSIVGCVVAHALNNGVVTVMLLVGMT
jgi:membrane protease YdiL (CAAX protease family)